MAGQGRGRGLGGQQSAATPADLGAESGDGGNQVLHHQRSETDWRSPCAVGRVRALERGACVPRREKRNRSDPFRRAQLCVVETSFGVVPGSNGLRQFAHDADPGGKIRRSPWSKSAEPWFSPVGNICAAYERRLKPIAWSTCSSTINFETPPPPALGKNAHDGSNVSLRCSVSFVGDDDSCDLVPPPGSYVGGNGGNDSGKRLVDLFQPKCPFTGSDLEILAHLLRGHRSGFVRVVLSGPLFGQGRIGIDIAVRPTHLGCTQIVSSLAPCGVCVAVHWLRHHDGIGPDAHVEAGRLWRSAGDCRHTSRGRRNELRFLAILRIYQICRAGSEAEFAKGVMIVAGLFSM